jgi:Rieske Fe-S protein
MSPSEARPKMDKVIGPGRRAFLKTSALTGIAAVLAGVPVLSYFIAPALKTGSGKWIDFGPADPQRGFVWAKVSSPEKITVFSSTCTHLACNVIWRKEKQIFECPCHSGHFDMDGRPIAGPPSKPLIVLDHRLEEGNLKVFMPA